MTEDGLEQLLREWQVRLRLERWDLRLRFDLPVADDNEAEIRVHDYYEQASVRISPSFVSWSPEWAEAVVVHELVHVFEKSVKRATDAVCEALPAAAREVFWQWYLFASEQMVENVSNALLNTAGRVIPEAAVRSPAGPSEAVVRMFATP